MSFGLIKQFVLSQEKTIFLSKFVSAFKFDNNMDLLNESSTTMATTTMMFNTATTTLSSADSVYSDQPNMTTSILIDLMTTTTLGTTMTTNNGTSLISASTISPSTMTTTINSIRMNMTTNYPRVTSFSPAIIHFTYYELNFFDIIFIACSKKTFLPYKQTNCPLIMCI